MLDTMRVRKIAQLERERNSRVILLVHGQETKRRPPPKRGGFSPAAPGFTAETDSPLEGDGFELSVPGHETVKPSWETALLSRKRKRICWGTESSNPSPSSGESGANLTFVVCRNLQGDEGR
jgi:hypothetical protein